MAAIFLSAALSAQMSAQINPLCPNDECANATPISGPGKWSLDDLTGATISTVAAPQCPRYINGYKDIWFCWTATFNGLASVDVGSNTVVQNQIFLGCGCPNPASVVLGCGNTPFDVFCGQKYLIRVGAEAYPEQLAQEFIQINKVSGRDCPPGAPQECDDCCGAKPTYTDQVYTSNYTGQVAVMTGNDDTAGSSNYPVVTIFNLKCSSPPPVPGLEWNPVFGAPTTPFRYSRPDWTKNNLGSVFGTTLDNLGNIYVAHSDIYGILGGSPTTCVTSSTAIGAVAGSSSTSVYRIPTGSGIPQLFVNLPGGSSNPSDPGLGNINYDCAHQEFFISHFGDGRIYRVSPAGAILGWYDHATDTIGLGATLDPAGPYSTFVRLGERVWAVQAHQGRLYYSVWGQNKDQFAPTSVVGTTPNRVWSVALTPAGDFVPSSRQQEVQTPAHPGNVYAPAALAFSSPIADISFSSSCRMLLAERDMSINNCTLGHGARALEYELNAGVWTPTNDRAGYGYEIGANDASLKGTNSAGGCDYDEADPADCASGRLWVTGDALIYNGSGGRVYGFTGVDTTTGFGYATALHVDYNSYYANGSYDKTKQGDIEIPCRNAAPPCLEVTNAKVLCPAAGTNCYTYTFDLTNHSGFSVKYVTIPLHPNPTSSITINPNVINLNVQDGSLLDDGETTTITLTICGGNPGDEFCIKLGLLTAGFFQCCFADVCLELPLCDCGQLRNQHIDQVSCPTPGTVAFSYSFTLDNFSPFAADWVIFIPNKDEQAVFVKDFFFLPPLQPGGSQQMKVEISGAQPGETFCFNVLLEHPGGPGEDCCCAFEKCITVPTCNQVPSTSCPGDVNGDGQVNTNDLLAVITGWGPCPASCPFNCLGDVNHDCVVNTLDLLVVINGWGVCNPAPR